jgi:FkbM family methyltransferase
MSAKDSLKALVPITLLRRAGNLRRRIRNAAITLNTGEVGYHLDIQEFGRHTFAFRTGTADENVLKNSVKMAALISDYTPQAGAVAIDVGAHIGTFSLMMASKVPDGKVFAIEASKETFNYLRVNIALNRVHNITPVHLALADAAGVATLHHDEGNWGHSIMKQWPSPSLCSEQVPKDSLENFCKVHQISQIALIKLDCEGAEFPILLNAPIDLLRNVHKMLIEYHLELVHHSREAIMERLRSAGFAPTVREEGKHRGFIVAPRQ